MTMVYVSGAPVCEDDLRYVFTGRPDGPLTVCVRHEQWARNRCPSFLCGSAISTPSSPLPCVACTSGERFEQFPIDARGNEYCGQDFMAGTICTLPPTHAGPHAPICQECSGDWYDGTCVCIDEDDDIEDDDIEDE